MFSFIAIFAFLCIIKSGLKGDKQYSISDNLLQYECLHKKKSNT